MNDKDIFELFQNDFIAGNTSDSYSHLCNFVSAMRCVQYYPISDEDIHRGVECEKSQTKNKAKILFMGFPEDAKKATVDKKLLANTSLFAKLRYEDYKKLSEEK